MSVPGARWRQFDRRVWPFLLAGLVFTGLVLRAVEFLVRRSLWVDEAMVALNIATRGFAELAQPLDLLQMAPILFLWIERAAIQLGGVHEWAFRALPLLAGATLVLVAPPLGREIARGVQTGERSSIAVWLTGWLALSPIFIRYSNELKPYIVDAALAILILWLALAALGTGTSAKRARSAAAIVGVATPWLSFGAVAVLIGAALVWVRNRAVLGLPRALLPVLAWLFSAGLAHMVATSSDAAEFQNFFEVPATSFVERLLFVTTWVPGTLAPIMMGGARTLIESVFGWLWLPLWVLVGVGTVRAWKTGAQDLLIMCLVPVGILWAAAVADQYPVAERLWFAVYPGLLALMALGLAYLVDRLRGKQTLLALALAAVIFYPTARWGLWTARNPLLGEHSRPIVDRLVEGRDGEPVYVFARALPAWLLYTTDWKDDGSVAALRPTLALASPPGPLYMNSVAPGASVSDPSFELPTPAGRVLLGRPSGLKIYLHTEGQPVNRTWAAEEASRIAEAFQPCGWLFLSHVLNPEREEALAAIEGAGGRRTDEIVELGPEALRYCFDQGGEFNGR